jgi:hypothetical protein
LSTIFELPAPILVALLIDRKQFGRKNFMAMSFLLAGITLLVLYSLKGQYFTYLASISKFFLLMTFTLAFQFTVEIYNTSIRGTGIGMASAISRIGSIVMPFVGFYLLDVQLLLPYLLFGIFSLIAFVLTMMLPYDTANRELDLLEDK